MGDQFPANSFSPEQLRQMQNIAALTGQSLNANNLGLIGNNLNILANPVALQIINRLLIQQQQQQPQQPQHQQPQHQPPQHQQSAHLPEQQKRKRGRPPLSGPSASSSGGSGTGSGGGGPSGFSVLQQQKTNNTTTVKMGDQFLANSFNPEQLRQMQNIAALTGQSLNTNNLGLIGNNLNILANPMATQIANRLLIHQQQQQQQQQQPPQSQHQAPQSAHLPEQLKRKRGRPPLSGPSTSSSGDVGVGPSGIAVLQQQRVQQERERQRLEAERQRKLQQRQAVHDMERERQKIEAERQRKLQHRQAIHDIERERRRQHMVMVRNLDAYKRNEEREKSMNAQAAERNKLMERRLHQKRLELELSKEIRKPVDDMMLKNHKPLATLNRIPGLKLPGKAFADLLMSCEFIYNFGETVGLTQKDSPDINTLQQGLLNLNTQAEDQFISLLYHLCMFAIKDPRFPYTGSLKEIENLEITNEGLSQLLHFYLQVLTLNAKTDMEHETRLYKLIEQKYFLSLNATQKAEMLAFICNELLCSQTVTKQMEDTIENVAKLRKDKWVLENEIRKYRLIKNKRELREAEQKAKEEAAAEAAAANSQSNGDNNEKDGEPAEGLEDNNEERRSTRLDVKREESLRNSSLTNGAVAFDPASGIKRENETDTSAHQQNSTADFDDLEPGLSYGDLLKKLENLVRQYNKTSNKLERAIYSMRANPLGQDRYRRRYWVLPQVGGVFVEGMESSEPEELENNKFTEEELLEYDKEQQELANQLSADVAAEEAEEGDTEKGENVKTEDDDDDMEAKEDGANIKDEDEEGMDIKEEDGVAEPDEGIKDDVKMETVENGDIDSERLANNNNEAANDDVNTQQAPTIPWFSILPRISCDFTRPPIKKPDDSVMDADENQKKVRDDESAEIKAELTIEELKSMRHEICPGLAKRLEDLEAEQYDSLRKIHPQFQNGWWRITDAQQLKTILSVLHERGSRERILHKQLTKHFHYACNSCKSSTVDFEITSYDRQLAGKNYGAPMPHTDDDSADDLKDGEEEDEEEEEEEDEIEEDEGNDRAVMPEPVAPTKKSKRKKSGSKTSARSRRLRARAAARKKVENSRNRLAQR